MKGLIRAAAVTTGALSVMCVAQPAFADQDYCSQVSCYGPAQIQQAYSLPALYARGITGKGVTIAVVEAYGSPTIAGDLRTFDAATGLPAPPSLKVISPDGQLPASQDASTWAVETTLDVEYAHAVAPQARIIVVEALPDVSDMIAAEQYAVRHYHAEVISQSLTEAEQIDPSAADIARMHAAYTGLADAGVSVVASSGDTGVANTGLDGVTYYLNRSTSYPASDPMVTAVGGTDLSLDSSGNRTAPDTVWNDGGSSPQASGGGTSVLFTRPAYQDSVRAVVGSARGVPDVSMSAACSAPVEIYLTDGSGSSDWEPACGTSEAAPLFAGVIALADQLAGHSLGQVNPALYQLAAAHASGIVPVTSGSNTVSFYQDGAEHTITGYSARSGYSLAAGVGTINAAAFVPELVAQTARDTAAARTARTAHPPVPFMACVAPRAKLA
jgi:subtilase family serine protease